MMFHGDESNSENSLSVSLSQSDPDALPASNYLVIQTPGDNLASVGAAQPNPGEQLPPAPPSAAGGAQPPPFGPTGSGGKGASVVSFFIVRSLISRRLRRRITCFDSQIFQTRN